jgi:prepilin-type N-terminal cleavage/methylation domain-containing protein
VHDVRTGRSKKSRHNQCEQAEPSASASAADRCVERAGFSLIEALVAVALMGVILFSLTLITGQWMPAWRRAYDRVQRSESPMIAFDRVAADIGAAEFVKVDRSSKAVLFEGTQRAITLVRTSVGSDTRRWHSGYCFLWCLVSD